MINILSRLYKNPLGTENVKNVRTRQETNSKQIITTLTKESHETNLFFP
jgi:hypothetical protein